MTKKALIFAAAAALAMSAAAGPARASRMKTERINVTIIKDPYSDSRTGPEKLKGPGRLFSAGLMDRLPSAGCRVGRVFEVAMPPEWEREYGEWNRASLTNHVLNTFIAGFDRGDSFFIGLLGGSKSLVGMLAGLQHLGPGRAPLRDETGREIKGLVRLGKGRPLRVGLVWISARGDFHTPDNTIEGDRGGMNVAMAAGLCLTDLRLQAGLDPPLAARYIVMAGLQDADAYERHSIDDSLVETLTVAEIQGPFDALRRQMDRLSRLTEIIYVHVDLSVLDPADAPGIRRVMGGGPSVGELAAGLRTIFEYPTAAALGIASLPDDAPDQTVTAAHRLIEGAVEGLRARKAPAGLEKGKRP